MKFILLLSSLQAFINVCFCQPGIPTSIKTDIVQTTIGDANGGEEVILRPVSLCLFFYLNDINNVLKYSDCNSLQDLEEIVIVGSDNVTGTASSWSKYYFGYNRKHPVFHSDGNQISNSHVTLIFRNNKYSIMIESSEYNKSGVKKSVVNMYYSL